MSFLPGPGTSMILRQESHVTFFRAADLLTQALAYRGESYRGGDLAVAWAVAALEEGLDSPSLATLAGLDSNDEFEIEKYLGAALDELSIPRPSPADGLWSYVRLVAEKAADGEIPGASALAELYALFDATGHDDRLSSFVYLADDLERLELGEEPLFFPGPDLEKGDDVVRTEARKLLSSLSRDSRDI